MCSERKDGVFTEPVPMSAYVGSSKNLKDLKDTSRPHVATRGATASGSAGLVRLQLHQVRNRDG